MSTLQASPAKGSDTVVLDYAQVQEILVHSVGQVADHISRVGLEHMSPGGHKGEDDRQKKVSKLTRATFCDQLKREFPGHAYLIHRFANGDEKTLKQKLYGKIATGKSDDEIRDSAELKNLGRLMNEHLGDETNIGARKKTSVVASTWVSNSEWHEIEGEIQRLYASLKGNPHPMMFFYYAVPKAGLRQPTDQTPDLSDLLFVARLECVSRVAGLRTVIFDEYAGIARSTGHEERLRLLSTRNYRDQTVNLLNMAAHSFGGRVKIQDAQVDRSKPEVAASEDDMRRYTEKVFPRIAPESTLEQNVDFANDVATFLSRRVHPPSDNVYLSITRKKGRINLRWPMGRTPNHGTAIVYPMSQGQGWNAAVVLDEEVRYLRKNSGVQVTPLSYTHPELGLRHLCYVLGNMNSSPAELIAQASVEMLQSRNGLSSGKVFLDDIARHAGLPFPHTDAYQEFKDSEGVKSLNV